MSAPISNLAELLGSMKPVLNAGTYAFVSVPEGMELDWSVVISCIREPEGLSVVMAEADAITQGLPILFRSAWVTLLVRSDLQAVGFTAAISAALGHAGISCNVVAGVYHDHIFVPHDRGPEAISILQALQHASSQVEDPCPPKADG